MTRRSEVIRAEKSGHVDLRCPKCGGSEIYANYNAHDQVIGKLWAHALALKCLGCDEKFSAHPECTGEEKCRWCRDLKGLPE